MDLQPCLYCRRVDVPRNREHVLQDGFGATAVLEREVCVDCNDTFSPLDKDFIDAVQFFHLGENIRRRFGLGLSVGDDGIALRARLRRDGLAEHPPQLYQTGPNEWKVIATDEESFRTLLSELAAPNALVVTSRVVAGVDGRPDLFILRSGPRKYLVEGTDPARVEALCVEMRTRGLQFTSIGTLEARSTEGTGPPLKYDLSLDFRRLGRALAKVALNFVCYRLGVATALQPTFDGLREFALEDRGDLWAFVKPSLLTGLDNAVAAPLVTGRQHVMILLRDRVGSVPRENVIVVVGGRVIGTVSLHPIGTPAEGLADGTWLVSRSDPTAHTWEDMRLPDDALRAFVNPAALGMEKEWMAMRALSRDQSMPDGEAP